MNQHSKPYWMWSLILLTVLVGGLLVALASRNVSGSAPITLPSFGFERISFALSPFFARFSRWFPQISYKYVLTPGLLELLFTFVLSSFLYREFVRVETEPLFDTSANRPERFRWLMIFGVVLTILVPLFIVWTFFSIVEDFANPGAMKSKLPAQSERGITFMLLVALNPMIYQLFVGLTMTLVVTRYRSILVPMLTLGLLFYAILLTTCFCLFDNGPFESLVFWASSEDVRATRSRPPEVALWFTGLFGVACLWLSLWPARKLLVRMNQTMPEQRVEHGSY